MIKHATASADPSLRKTIEAGVLQPGMNFDQKAWAVCARIPKGKVTTYAAIAKALGGQAYRAVGMAMNRNPFAPRVPCHRVVASDGRLNGYAHGLPAKEKMLRGEGVAVERQRVDLNTYFWDPSAA